jgi:anti-sigma regulatory factor (Ser/Thr protein kinase)
MTQQQTDPASSPVSLVVPCRPEYVGLCRLVAGALGGRDSLDEEVIADLKVIVTEACNCFLAVAGSAQAGEGATCGDQQPALDRNAAEPNAVAPGCSIRMDFNSRPDAFVISVFYPEKRELVSWLESCDPMGEAGLGLTILKSLADEMVEIDTEAEGTVLRLTKFLPA